MQVRPFVLGLVLAFVAGITGAAPASATVTSAFRGAAEDFAATGQRSFTLPAGRQVVTATVSVRPQDPLSQDLRCALQTVSATGVVGLVDEATVRAQQQVSPIRKESNALPHFALHGVVTGPVVLRFGCTRVSGSGVVPQIDRLTVVSEVDSSAVADPRTATTLSALPSVQASGLHRAVATVSLDPQDARAGDLRCGLYVRPGGAELAVTLDETVVRVRRTVAPETGPSNALPRITLAGLRDLGTGGRAFVECTRVSTAGYVQPLVPRANLVVQRVAAGDVRVAEDGIVTAGDTIVSVNQSRTDGSTNPRTFVATLTLVPRSETMGVLSCRLARFQGANELEVLDRTVVTVRAAFAPDPLTSNAFPRITLVGTGTLRPSTSFQVRCTPFVVPGLVFAQPRIDRATLVALPAGSVAAL